MFFQKWPNLHERCGMGWNERKIHFTIFTNFFWDMAVFILEIGQILMNFDYRIDDNSENKKSERYFTVHVSISKQRENSFIIY